MSAKLYLIEQCYLVAIRGYFMVDEIVEQVMLSCTHLLCCLAAGRVETAKMAGNQSCKIYIKSYANFTPRRRQKAKDHDRSTIRIDGEQATSGGRRDRRRLTVF